MVKEIEGTIKSIAVLPDNAEYRYKLTRVWDETKPKATLIMLNPSKADMLKSDKTVMNVTNYLIDNEYGSVDIVNLFSYITTDPKNLIRRDDTFEALNNEYLTSAFSEAETIIVAWARDKYKTRKKAVEAMLKEHKMKVKCFQDTEGRKPRHPRDLGEGWTLVEYVF